MGACAGKKEGGASTAPAKYEKLGLAAADSHFKDAQSAADSLEKPVAAIMKNKAAFIQLSKLYLEPNQRLESGVIGMALYLVSSLD